jgi:pSer/pThr/pTyr-binding forkhead associated (FHA) protein
MLGKLAPCGGGPTIPLLKPKLLLGRQSSCDVPLRFPTVSARHCELELRDGYWFVRDLGSRHGTRVNGTRCTAEWLLPDDVLAVSVHRYTALYTPPADQPPPRRLVIPVVDKPPSPASAANPAAAGRPADQQVWEPAPADPPLGKLVPCGGGASIPLLRPNLVVGRHPSCDIVLRFAPVSGRHCELEWSEGSWFVRDLGSRNGTRVDGTRCQAQRVSPGSILWIGGLRFEMVYKPEGAAEQADLRKRRFTQGLLEKAGLLGWRAEPTHKEEAEAGDDPSRRRPE